MAHTNIGRHIMVDRIPEFRGSTGLAEMTRINDFREASKKSHTNCEDKIVTKSHAVLLSEFKAEQKK